MKEPFITADAYAAQVQALTDLEFQAYLSALSNDEKKNLSAVAINEMLNQSKTSKQTIYKDKMDMVIGADNSITAAVYYLDRTEDLNNLASNVNGVVQNQLSTLDKDTNTNGRQKEINEWANFNKIDSIYFMQILFIVLTFTSILLFFQMHGYISGYVFTLLSTLAGLIAGLILLFSTRYNNVSRNSRYWHKARFTKPVGA